jgi:hypothetical protein
MRVVSTDRKNLDTYDIEEIRGEKLLAKLREAVSRGEGLLRIELGNSKIKTGTYFVSKSNLEKLLRYGDELKLNKGIYLIYYSLVSLFEFWVIAAGWMVWQKNYLWFYFF